MWVHEVRLPADVEAHIQSRLVESERVGLDRGWWKTAHIDHGTAGSTPPTTTDSARARLQSTWRDRCSQRQSEAVIYAKADGLHSALEEATQLGR